MKKLKTATKTLYNFSSNYHKDEDGRIICTSHRFGRETRQSERYAKRLESKLEAKKHHHNSKLEKWLLELKNSGFPIGRISSLRKKHEIKFIPWTNVQLMRYERLLKGGK